MTIDTLTMHEKLIIVRSMIERGQLLVVFPVGDREDKFEELSAHFTPDRDRIEIEI